MKRSGGENSAIFLIGEYAMDLTKKKKILVKHRNPAKASLQLMFPIKKQCDRVMTNKQTRNESPRWVLCMADHCLCGSDGDLQPSHTRRLFQVGAVPPGVATAICFQSGKANFGEF